MCHPEIESPYNRVRESAPKDTVSIPEWLLEVINKYQVLPLKRVDVPIPKDLYRAIQSSVDRAVLELERALETMRMGK